MTAAKTARPGYTLYTDRNSCLVEIPESTVVGKNCNFRHQETPQIGKDCAFGDDITLDAKIGDYCTIGNNTTVHAGYGYAREEQDIGNNVHIGSEGRLNICRIGNDVRIGDRVILDGPIVITDGVIIPNGWEIPKEAGSMTINAGLDGSPICIQHMPRFECAGQGHVSGRRGW